MLADLARAVDRRLAIACAVACVAATLAPFLVTRDLPFTDLPNHLGSVAIWHHYDDARYGFAQYYELQISPVPYYAYYGFVHWLGYLMPLRAASSLFVLLGALAAPAGLYALCRAHGRPTVLALGGFPLFWSFPLAFGFVNFATALGPLFFACALLARLADARPFAGWQLWAANCAMGMLLYFFHHLPLMLWLVAVAIYLPRRAWVVALPALLLFVWATGKTPGAAARPDLVGPELHVRFLSLKQVWDLSPRWVLDFVSGHWREKIAYTLLGAWLAAQALTRRDPAAEADHRPWLLLASYVALIVLLPLKLMKPMAWENVATRMPSVACMTAFACAPRGMLAGWRRLVVLVPLVAVGVGLPLTIARKFQGFEKRAKDFRAIVQLLPYNPSVLTLIFNGGSDPTNQIKDDGPWLEFASYVQLERGGYNPGAWDVGFPMKLKPGKGKPAPSGFHPGAFTWAGHGRHYEYFLTRGEPGGFWKDKPVELMQARGSWRLYRKIEANPPPPAPPQKAIPALRVDEVPLLPAPM